MRRCYLGIIGAVACGAVHSASTDLPSWLDTTPPTVAVDPPSGTYNKVLTVTFSLNERGAVYVGRSSQGPFQTTTTPVVIADEGRTVLYYYAEDLLENRTPVDSVVYVIDTRSPRLQVTPQSGVFPGPVTVRLTSDEPCAFFAHRTPNDLPGKAIGDSLVVVDSFAGYFSAVDRAGNRTMGTPVRYVVGKASATVSIDPEGGTFRGSKSFTLRSSEPCTLYYSFDPLALPADFVRYESPVQLPPGQTLVRYFGVDLRGRHTAIGSAMFHVDTSEIRVRVRAVPGKGADTLYLTARGAERIHYSFGPELPTESSPVYTTPLVVPRVGKVRLWAMAVDREGQQSAITTWEQKYDVVPPEVSISPSGGVFNRSVRVSVRSSEPGTIHCTSDGSEPGLRSPVVADGVVTISRQGRTVLRCVAVDRAGNVSEERSAIFTVDSIPPRVRVRVEQAAGTNVWRVHLGTDEKARIYYLVGRTRVVPGTGIVYEGPVELRSNEVLSYYAVDEAGNQSRVGVLDGADAGEVRVQPRSGTYNRAVGITFTGAPGSVVYYRVGPDTSFRIYEDTVRLMDDGAYTLEYYAEGPGLGEKITHREEYVIDRVPPRVRVTLKRAVGDTAWVLFEASENATIYYTLDGSNPLSSPTVRTAAGKHIRSKDRVKVCRTPDARLAFYAEDAAGNRSRVTLIDLFKPRVTANVPDGPEIVHDRILSVMLSTFDEGARIYYARHGHIPTRDSALYREPITLVRSDTICAFAIDRTGTAGDIDTFVFLMDLPPVPAFGPGVPPESLIAGRTVVLDASATTDNESPLSRLLFRWDFDGDGEFDTPFEARPVTSHVFTRPGIYPITLEVRDERGRTARREEQLAVLGQCPADMVFVPEKGGGGFCIDRYEWPNQKGVSPRTHVSWVEAKMLCFDNGKRLCTAREWQAACRGGNTQPYPYGTEYVPDRCATEGKKPHSAGSFPGCGEPYGIRDMVGNVWEWVEDKRNGAPLQMGGSFRLGSLAHCDQVTEGRIAARSSEVGFRCCK